MTQRIEYTALSGERRWADTQPEHAQAIAAMIAAGNPQNLEVMAKQYDALGRNPEAMLVRFASNDIRERLATGVELTRPSLGQKRSPVGVALVAAAAAFALDLV
jgi:hypothetical protein